jgi:predicted RNA-binding Zn-ribbon protein involved in translation (DUF1610 family)
MYEVTDSKLIPVHVCKSCGARIDRKSIAPETIISGFIPCPKCGHEDALNLEILGVGAKLPPGRETAA